MCFKGNRDEEAGRGGKRRSKRNQRRISLGLTAYFVIGREREKERVVGTEDGGPYSGFDRLYMLQRGAANPKLLVLSKENLLVRLEWLLALVCCHHVVVYVFRADILSDICTTHVRHINLSVSEAWRLVS